MCGFQQKVKAASGEEILRKIFRSSSRRRTKVRREGENGKRKRNFNKNEENRKVFNLSLIKFAQIKSGAIPYPTLKYSFRFRSYQKVKAAAKRF